MHRQPLIKLMTSLVLAAVCGMVVWARLPMSAHAEGDAPKRIGVVSVSRIFNVYKKMADVQKQLDAEISPRKLELEERGRKVKDWQDKLKQGIESGQKEDVIELQRFELVKLQLERDFRDFAKDIEKRRMKELKQVLREIYSGIREIALAGKYDLILRSPEYDDAGNPVTPFHAEANEDQVQSTDELLSRWRENAVFYYSSEVNLTQAVVTKLNDDYAKVRK